MNDGLMTIKTTRGNTYSYSHHTNEIYVGENVDEGTKWKFAPLISFNNMSEISMFVIGITEQCNLRCTYCCYSGLYNAKRTHSSKHLNNADIDDIYTFIRSITTKKPIRIAFYGGEPILQLNLIKYAVTKGKSLFGSDITFSLSTNGTTLTPSIIEWLIQEKIEIAISIDGVGKYHDRCRKDNAGNGSFDRVLTSIKFITQYHRDYLENVSLLMTITSFKDISEIAIAWANNGVLADLKPSNIHGLSPNFANGVPLANFDEIKKEYIRLLDLYEQKTYLNVLKVYFDECISYWKERPIIACDEDIPMSTCLPVNTKLYIDSDKRIGVCEKMSDHIRIGNVVNGIDWVQANAIVESYYKIRKVRCLYCPAIRMCDMCLTALEFNPDQWDILCQMNGYIQKRLLFIVKWLNEE